MTESQVPREALEGSERDHPKDTSYLCKCYICGKGYAGPKRSLACYLCLNKKK